MASDVNLYQQSFLSILKGGLCYEVIFKLQYNFALRDCTSEALHRVESPRYIIFLNQSNNYKINYNFQFLK